MNQTVESPAEDMDPYSTSQPLAHRAGSDAMDSGADMSDDDLGDMSSKGWLAADVASPDGSSKSSTDQSPIKTENPGGSSNEVSSIPTQKRRRVTRACDECRRKKIKCDGKQPCTHCSVYSYGIACPSLPRRSRSLAS